VRSVTSHTGNPAATKGVGQRQRVLTASNTTTVMIRCFVNSAVVRFAAD
jgi:hypothetical protein